MRKQPLTVELSHDHTSLLSQYQISLEAVERDHLNVQPTKVPENVAILLQKHHPNEEKSAVTPCLITSKSAPEHRRLYFRQSTLNNGSGKNKKQQHFYRLIAHLQAFDESGQLHTIRSLVSSPLIIRGSNPASYNPNQLSEDILSNSESVKPTSSPFTLVDKKMLEQQQQIIHQLQLQQQQHQQQGIRFQSLSSNGTSESSSGSSGITSPELLVTHLTSIQEEIEINMNTPQDLSSQNLFDSNYAQLLQSSSSSSSPSSLASLTGIYNILDPQCQQQQMEQQQSFQDANSTSFYQPETVVSFVGKVGINTENPIESLSVQGNISVTGDIYKPSDRRIKSELMQKDPEDQLDRIRKLKIYDYQRKDLQTGQLFPETGVIAQELQQVLPSAVKNVGTMMIGPGGEEIPDFCVVKERDLLMENIGATQALDLKVGSIQESVDSLKASSQNPKKSKTTKRSRSSNANPGKPSEPFASICFSIFFKLMLVFLLFVFVFTLCAAITALVRVHSHNGHNQPTPPSGTHQPTHQPQNQPGNFPPPSMSPLVLSPSNSLLPSPSVVLFS